MNQGSRSFDITLIRIRICKGALSGLQSKVARQMASLCPSIALLHKELTREGIDLDIKTSQTNPPNQCG